MGIKITIPNTSSDVLTFGSGNTPTAAQIAGIDSGSSNGQLALYTTASGTSTERVRINASGNVGIGTASPAYKLNVEGERIGLTNGNSGAWITHQIQNQVGTAFYIGNESSSGGTFVSTPYSRFLWSSGAYPMVFGVNSAERARIDSSGNLLVGTTSTVNPGGVTGTASFKTSTSSRWAGAFENSSSSSPWGVGVTYTGAAPNNTSNAFFYGVDTGGDRFYMRSNGGLANYSANNFNLASDLRLKKDIQPVQSYWNVFKSIEWKTWLYNDQTDEIKNIGVIAQELQALAPELVCESNALPTPEGESPYLGLWENDFKMAGMSVITELVKRCEEQQAIITSLTDRLTALENK